MSVSRAPGTQAVNNETNKQYLSKNFVIEHVLDELRGIEAIQNPKIFANPEVIERQTIVKFLMLSFAVNCDVINPHDIRVAWWLSNNFLPLFLTLFPNNNARIRDLLITNGTTIAFCNKNSADNLISTKFIILYPL